jgi:dsDNA-specific endonuclease/ATPase MutS2
MEFINRESLKSLNIPEITEKIRPCSEVGKRLKGAAKPFLTGKEEELREEYARIRTLMEKITEQRSFYPALSASLAKIENIRQTFKKAVETEILEPTDIFEIKSFLYYYERIRGQLEKYQLRQLVKLDSFSELYNYLDPENQNVPTFQISSKYSPRLGSLRIKFSELRNRIRLLENDCLELAKKDLELNSIEKQVVVSRLDKKMRQKLDFSEWFTLSEENFANITFSFRQPEEIIRLEGELSVLKQKIEEAELVVRREITAKIARRGHDLITGLNEIAKLDYLVARADFGCRIGGIIPEIREAKELQDGLPESEIKFLRSVNLFIKEQLSLCKIDYQPVDIDFRNKLNIITGANMAGKSTILKTAGQLFLLAAYAIPLPCKEGKLPLVDFIFYSSDNETSNRTDLSSFASELIGLKNALKKPGKGLFLIDEFARGTNPQEGEAFARAVLEVFIDRNSLVVSATHFSSPSQIAQAGHYRVTGLTKNDYAKLQETFKPFAPEKTQDETADREDLKKRLQELHKYMNYQIESVESSNIPPRTALMIAEVLGVDEEIIRKVKKSMKRGATVSDKE